MSNIHFITAAIVSSWVAGPWYGLNLALYFICVRILLGKWSIHGSRVLFVAATVQICLCTGHLVTMLVQLLQGLPVDEHGVGRLDNAYFRDQITHAHIAEEVFYITNSLVGDAIMIWRVYVVWEKNHMVYSPLLLLFVATGVSACIVMAHMAHLDLLNTQAAVLARWIEATWCLSIATQVLATLLIGFKLIAAARGQRKLGLMQSSLYISTFWVVIESGAGYTITTVLLLSFYVRGLNAGAICAAFLGQLSATAPYLMIVRAETNRQARKRKNRIPLPLYKTYSDGRQSSASFPRTSQGSSEYEIDRMPSVYASSGPHPPKAIQIMVETETQQSP
ncbi:hypothetical protein PENSPDRAFT_758850 [Peniophora sp. CONT]|nr:hypothetical protein PENSPDRAFT_758850 [Peniophora sp. CONT]